MFNIHKVETQWGGKTLTLETGRIAKTAPAAELLADDDVRRAYLGY